MTRDGSVGSGSRRGRPPWSSRRLARPAFAQHAGFGGRLVPPQGVLSTGSLAHAQAWNAKIPNLRHVLPHRGLSAVCLRLPVLAPARFMAEQVCNAANGIYRQQLLPDVNLLWW